MSSVRAEALKDKRAQILEIASKYGAQNLRIFGSVARGEDRPDSDVDFLVEMDEGRSLFDLARMTVELEDLLRCQVDLVDQSALHWYLRDKILGQAQRL